MPNVYWFTKKTLALLILIYPKLSVGEVFKISANGKYKEVQVIEYKKMRFSSNCFKAKVPQCAAFEATKEKVPMIGSQTPYIGHPASNYCKSKRGLSRILIGKENKQYDYCLFQDGSMVDSWDLFYNHFPKKVQN